jgi:glycosyltransferase involved in cell wall biosynthesis
MRLGINGWRLAATRTGVGRYLSSLIRHWRRGASRVFDRITLYTQSALPADTVVPDGVDVCVLGPAMRLIAWENLRLGPSTRDEVLFCPSYTRPIVVHGRPVVATHDVVYCAHPELFPASQRWFYTPAYRWSARHAALVIADTEAVKADIVRFFGVDAGRIRVTYLAPAECFRPLGGDAVRGRVRANGLALDEPFFLSVGKMTGRRRPLVMVEAFARLVRRTSLPHHLVIVGPRETGAAAEALAAGLGIGARVHLAGFLDDEDVNRLYNAADALVMPSMYETGSLPVVEAQAAGLPVICVRNPGMSEITGDVARFFDRLSPDALADPMIELAEDDRLRASLSARGLEHVRRFSWARCAADTMAVLEEAAALGRPALR